MLLRDDPLLVLILPEPDPLDERLATDVVARLPLEFEERPAKDKKEAEPASESDSWTPIEILAELEGLELEIGVAQASASARTWWRKLQDRFESTPQMLLRIALETKKRRTTLERLHEAYLESGVESFQGMFDYLSYMMVRDKERRGSSSARPSGPRPSLDDGNPDQFSKELEAFFERRARGKRKKPRSTDNSGTAGDDIPF